MSRRVRDVVWAVTIALAGCGQVDNKSQDAGSRDSAASIDAPPRDAAGPQSIVAVHRVFEMQRADQVLPVSVKTTSGRAVIVAAGSGQCASGFAIGMSIKLDGTSIGTSRAATNELNSSKAFVRNAILVDLIAGTHTVAIEPLPGTIMGANEFVDVTVIELGAYGTAATIFDDVAPPYSGTFPAGGGHGVLLAGGSGYTSAGAGIIGMDVRLNGQPIGVVKTYTNEVSSHKAFGADHRVLTPGAGSPTLSLVALSGTSVDYNDRASALWLELGSDVTPSQVIDHGPGPLPLSNSFVASGGQIMMLVSGSGYGSTGGVVEVAVKLDSVAIGSAKVVTAEVSSHKTVVPTVLLAQPAAGTHMLTLAAATGTNTDYNDFFNVTMIDLGP